MSIQSQFNNNPLKDGYIFIPMANARELPAAYFAAHLGAFGYFARLDPEATNGFDPIPFQIYEDA